MSSDPNDPTVLPAGLELARTTLNSISPPRSLSGSIGRDPRSRIAKFTRAPGWIDGAIDRCW
jgi:hypothetical protein